MSWDIIDCVAMVFAQGLSVVPRTTYDECFTTCLRRVSAFPHKVLYSHFGRGTGGKMLTKTEGKNIT